ncbi:Bug family tripartite tricarboxylate transporter substrate binding protein [Polynucleobacter kasalickyi]|uniref:Tripartite-type tricarboxylate transporter, receptor component TctC n=1 Tax=Polynucleobacter kasalickyi TaxID=1938817 RepID=A0A1W2BNC1_9BURK|nr:tripartite tricarboxylate transporter substrate binding protein [Polynucleobacter kasalickyi]SMC73998.1 Tripartite-type tricarboxylate transporter, receptor component TctC [Polynucleobacter kasalickyi]
MFKLFLTLFSLLVSQITLAAYPERSIRLVVPFATGGTSEIIARSVANSLSTSLGQSVYVENKPGGAGNIAMEEVKRAKPDGYTLMLGHVGTLAVNPALFGNKLPYDPNADFAPVTLIAKVPNIIAVSEKSPYKTLGELVADAKKNPGKINYGSAGNGSAGHLAMEYFSSEAGIDLVHVPYKGSGPMLTDLIGDQIQATFNGLPSLIGQFKGKALRPLATGSAERSKVLSNVPTISELGYKGFETSQWYGIIVPAGTPQAIIDRLQKEIAKGLSSKEESKRMLEDGAVLIGDTPTQFSAFIKSEQARWAKVVEKAKISLD